MEYKSRPLVFYLPLTSHKSPCLTNLPLDNHQFSPLGAANVVGGHLLEEATEFEFMRNILYKYMLGQNGQGDASLAKVLIRVAKFDPEMAEAVLRREEEKSKSILSSIGLG